MSEGKADIKTPRLRTPATSNPPRSDRFGGQTLKWTPSTRHSEPGLFNHEAELEDSVASTITGTRATH